MSDQFAVIIPAAGKSSRFGGIEKKPFTSLDGRPVWLRSAELFWSREDVSRVYVVIAPEDRDDFRTRFGHLLLFTNVELVEGGSERFESVSNALARVPKEVAYIAVHDAVRPLITTPFIDSIFAAARTHGAVVPGIAVADTLKQVEPKTNRIVGTPSRAGLWQAQTPQVFRRDWLAEAYARREEFAGTITDDSQLIEAIGHAVFMVPGAATNFKITTRDDLELADAILKARTTRRPEPRPTAGPFDDEAKW